MSFAHDKNSEIALIFPPNWDISLPYLSIPCLSAFLRSRNIPVYGIDANIQAFHYLMRTDNIKRCLEHIKNNQNHSIDMKHKTLLNKTEKIADEIIQYKDDALKYFESPYNLRDYHKLLWSKSILEEVYDIYSARYYPVQFSFSNNTIYNLVNRFNPKEIIEFSNNDDYPLRSYYEMELIPQILENNPSLSLIGISVISRDQLLHSIYLAKLLKKARPDIHITSGGCFFYFHSEKIKGNIYPLDLYFDSIIFGQGEIPLYNLFNILKGKKSEGDEYANILFTKDPQSFYFKNLAKNFKDYPSPDFDDYQLKKYISNDIMLPYQMASGCYYGKCSFCNSRCATTSDYILKDPLKVFNDIKWMKERYNCSIFHINDEALNFNSFIKIHEKLSKLNLSFVTEARFEKNLTKDKLEKLKKAGIKKIAFGFESANEKVLNLMQKGYEIKKAKEILENCYDTGIEVHLFGILGFPGETEADRLDTINFIRDLKHFKNSLLFSYSFHLFLLEYGSDIFYNPSKYGINEIIEKEKFNFAFEYKLIGDDQIYDSDSYSSIRDEFYEKLYSYKPIAKEFPFFSELIYLQHFEKEEYKKILTIKKPHINDRLILKTGEDKQKFVYDLKNKSFYAIDNMVYDIFILMKEKGNTDLSLIASELKIPKAFIKSKLKNFGFDYLIK